MDILDVLNKKLDEKIEQLSLALSDGSAKSFDHYKELCGQVRGLRAAQLEIADLVRKIKDSDND